MTEQSQMPLICLCMIVRNEERHLARCLESAMTWVDQAVVVDTGSTDRTIKIAQGFGARVVTRPWRDDFAEARNHALDLADGDWLLVLDADEELGPESGPNLRPTVAESRANGLALELMNLMPGGGFGLLMATRLLRNGVGIRYQGAIHETPIGVGPVQPTKLRIIHHGYSLPPAAREAKHVQRLAILKRWVERSPNNPVAHTYLAQRLNAHGGQAAEALEHGLIALRLAEELGPRRLEMDRIFRAVCFSLASLGRFDELIECARRFQAALPEHPDGFFLELGAQVEMSRWPAIEAVSAKLLALLDRWNAHSGGIPFNESVSLKQTPLVLQSRTRALAHLGRNQEALDCFARLAGVQALEQAAGNLAAGLKREGFDEMAREMASLAARLQPGWPWPKGLAAD